MIQLRNDVTTNDPRLDRIPHFDPKSRQYPIRALFGAPAHEIPLRSYTWRCSVNLDQGQEGACVGFSLTQELAARPSVVRDVSNEFARKLYFYIQKNDPWEGGAYPGAFPFYEGTATDAGAAAMKRLGYYLEYRWADTERDLAVTLGYKGPAVIGINWYTGMFRPDSSGILHVTGQVEGGHAILVNGFSAKKGLYQVWNSWGKDWGQGGAAYITRGDMARLLSEQGDAMIPIRSRKQLQTVVIPE